MHRVLLVPMLAAALLVPSAWSQRGGGMRAMGGHTGFSHAPAFAGRSGFSGRQPGFAGHNSVFVGSRFGRFGRPFPHRFFGGGFGNRFFFSAGFGFPLAYPYYYGGYYPSYYSYPSSYAPGYA